MRESFNITSSSFKRLYDCHFEPLCKFLAFYSNDRMKIEEVVQDVFVKLWQERDILQIESMTAWLFTSARNRMLNTLRDEKRHNALIEQWVQHELEQRNSKECFDIEQFMQKVQDAVETLPDKCRKIFYLSKSKNLTYKQIAEHLDISVKTVETQMGIALRKVRERLGTLYPNQK